MTTPVHTIGAEVLAPEASIAMMATGVNHLPVLDAEGDVVGILSASNLMTLDARSPFALRRSLQTAATQDDLVEAAADVPHLFVDLLDAHLDAPALMRVLTVLSDAMTARLLELAIDRHGRPPVPFAWLAFGSCARSELTLASDQDNGLAYADTDDPAVDEYFRLVAEEVNEGLQRCGFVLDPHGVLARYRAVAHAAVRLEAGLRRLPRGQATSSAWRAPASPSTFARWPASSTSTRCSPRSCARRPSTSASCAAWPSSAQRIARAARLSPAARGQHRHQEARPRAHPEPGPLLRLRPRHHARTRPSSA